MRFLILSLCVASMHAIADPALEQTAPNTPQVNEALATGAVSAELKDEAASKPVAQTKAEDKGPVFNIFEYRVEGSTVLSAGQIEEAVYPFLGENKTVDDAEKARSALEKAFHKAGYLTVFVNIPEQEVNTGVVRLEVQEGTVEKLRVVGSKYYSLGRIKNTVSEFEEGKVPYFPTAQKQIASLNASDRKVAPILRPGKSPGKVEIDLKVEDKLPFHGGIEINDRYSNFTSPTRLSGSVRYDNLWQRDHSIGISFQVTPENVEETKVLSATYLIPNNGDYWAFYGVISLSDVLASTTGVIGNGNIIGLRYIHPLAALDDFSHSITLGADFKDFKETATPQGTDEIITPIQYMPFSIAYDATLNSKQSLTKFNIGSTFSFRGFVNNVNDFAQKRFLAKPDFMYMRAEIEHTQSIYKNWSLIAKVSGQLTDQPLISNEQFGIGGLETVRGYLESDSFGDDGVLASLELRTPPLAKYLPDQITDAYVAGFYDWGHVGVQNPLPSVIESGTDNFTLASYGFGVQIKGFKGAFAGLSLAKALFDSQQRDPANLVTVRKDDYRIHFRFGYDW